MENRVRVEDGTVALGEATGHSHRLVGGTVWKEVDGSLTIEVTEPGAKLVHEEHKPIPVDIGEYKVSQIREVDPFSEAIRTVAD